MIRFQAKPAEAEVLQSELTATRMPGAIVSAELPLLGGKSLEQLSGDESMLLPRTVVARVIEQYDAIASKGEQLVAEVYQRAGLEPLPPLKPSDSEIETLPNEDLNRVDPSELSTESLVYLLQRAQQVSATPAMRHFATKLIEGDVSKEQSPAKLLAYMTLVNAAPDTGAALTRLEEAKAFGESNGLSIANLLLSEVGLRLQSGDGPGFQKAIETLSSRYSHEPDVMAQLQQLLMAYGLIGPDGAPRQAPQAGPAAATPADQQPGGIWTPDGGTSAPAEPAPEGGSKLWIPGMD